MATVRGKVIQVVAAAIGSRTMAGKATRTIAAVSQVAVFGIAKSITTHQHQEIPHLQVLGAER